MLNHQNAELHVKHLQLFRSNLNMYIHGRALYKLEGLLEREELMNEYLAEEILSDDKPLLHRFFSDDDESAIDKCLRGKRFLAVVMLHRVDTGTFIKEIR